MLCYVQSFDDVTEIISFDVNFGSVRISIYGLDAINGFMSTCQQKSNDAIAIYLYNSDKAFEIIKKLKSKKLNETS